MRAAACSVPASSTRIGGTRGRKTGVPRFHVGPGKRRKRGRVRTIPCFRGASFAAKSENETSHPPSSASLSEDGIREHTRGKAGFLGVARPIGGSLRRVAAARRPLCPYALAGAHVARGFFSVLPNGGADAGRLGPG